MAVNHVIQLRTGGTVVVSMDGVNLLAANEIERELLQSIGEAVRQYERRQAAESGPKSAIIKPARQDGTEA